MKITKNEKLLKSREVAQRLGLSVLTLTDWRTDRKGPVFCKLNGAVRYPESLLNDWIESRKVKP